MAEETIETMRAMLLAGVARRFGEERADAIRADIDALAADLLRVATASLPDDVEPDPGGGA